MDMPYGWTAETEYGAAVDATRAYLALGRYARVLLPVEALRLEFYAAAWFYRATQIAREFSADEELRNALREEMDGNREAAAEHFRRAADHRRASKRWMKGGDWDAAVTAVDMDHGGLRGAMARAFPFGVRA